MKTIYKYALFIVDEQMVALPEGAHIMSVVEQGDKPVLYARCDPTMPVKHVKVWVIGTGHECSHVEGHGFAGTVAIMDGALMFHVFFEVPKQCFDERHKATF